MSFKVIKNIIKLSVNCPLCKAEKELLHKLQDVIVSERVYNFYKTKLRNNSEDVYEVCRLKLIRNILLSSWQPINKARPERRLFTYGNLSVLWDENLNEIVWLDNKEGYYPFKADAEKKQWLNTYLGINTYKMGKVG